MRGWVKCWTFKGIFIWSDLAPALQLAATSRQPRFASGQAIKSTKTPTASLQGTRSMLHPELPTAPRSAQTAEPPTATCSACRSPRKAPGKPRPRQCRQAGSVHSQKLINWANAGKWTGTKVHSPWRYHRSHRRWGRATQGHQQSPQHEGDTGT